jgi:aldose 1-epimerase
VQTPTGEQFSLYFSGPSGHATATIVQLAASLREYRVDGVDVVEPYAPSEHTPYGSGMVLVPWPNRVANGQWSLDGEPQQLEITEPAFNNALHGLLVTTFYEPVERSANAVTLAATVHPQAGYPFLLETSVRYELLDDGLTVSHSIRNLSTRSAPVAVGAHPYLRIGDVPTDDLVLRIAAGSRFEVDEQFIPTAEVPIEGFDGGRLGDLELNDAFGRVPFTDGIAVHSITAPDGRRVELWQDASFGYVQVYTCRVFPSARVLRFAVAIEPMTAPPNALATGQGLRWLEPGEVWELRWGIRPQLSWPTRMPQANAGGTRAHATLNESGL